MSQFFTKTKGNLIGTIIFALVIFITIFTVFLGVFFKSEEKIKVLFKNGELLTVFVAGIDHDKNISGAFVFFFQTSNNKTLTLNILPKTFIKFKDIHFTLEESLNKKISYEQITQSVSELIGNKINYYIFLEKDNLVKLIDMINGVEIYTRKIKYPELNVNIPEGVLLLDGDKTVEYLSFLASDDIDAQYDQLKRTQNFLRGLLKIKSGFFESFNQKIIINYLYKTMITNFDVTEFVIIYDELLNRIKNNVSDYSTGLKTIILYCDKKYIDENKYVYLPKKSGEWIKSEINDSVDYLKSKKEEKASHDKIIVEIMNGTDIIGLALKAKSYLSSYGFEISNVANATSNDYENTVVIAHSNESKGKKIADLIKCERVVVDEEADKKIDVTIILGRDYDGKIVR